MNCSGGGSALAVGRRYGLIPVVWKMRIVIQLVLSFQKKVIVVLIK